MLADRIIRYQKAARAAREKAMTAQDPEQWFTIADAWDELARRVESERRFRADFFEVRCRLDLLKERNAPPMS